MLPKPLILEVIADLVLSVLSENRRPILDRTGLLDTDMLWPEGAALDSLERLNAATAVAQFFGLAETGHEDLLLAYPRLTEWAGLVERTVTSDQRQVFFNTSGSTGKPSQVAHSWQDLREEIACMLPVVGTPRRVVATVGVNHIYGFLWGPMLASLAGADFRSLRGSSPAGWRRELRAGDVVICVPALLRVWLPHLSAVPEGLTVITSTQMLGADLWQDCAVTGFRRVLEIYGSTETGGIGWRDAADAPFALMRRWEREDAGHLRSVGDVTGGDRSRPVPIPDRVEWDGPDRLRVLGRHDTVVKVYGQRVALDHVRRVLVEHPAVADACVRLMSDGEGQKLKAFIVPATDSDRRSDLPNQLDEWVADRLRPEERPGHWTFGPAVPVTEGGKATDWPIA